MMKSPSSKTCLLRAFLIFALASTQLFEVQARRVRKRPRFDGIELIPLREVKDYLAISLMEPSSVFQVSITKTFSDNVRDNSSIHHRRARSIDAVYDNEKRGFVQINVAPPTTLDAPLHGKAVLECSATGTPTPTITWLKNGLPVVQDQGMNEQDVDLEQSFGNAVSKLFIDCVTENDAGFYECNVDNSNGQAAAGTVLEVGSNGDLTGCNVNDMAPKINFWFSTYLQIIGFSAKLSCGSNGIHETTWFGPYNQEIQTGSKYMILANGDLIIKDLIFNDMGLYKCKVSNAFGYDSKETFVYPLGA